MMDIGQIDTNLMQMLFGSKVASPMANLPMGEATGSSDFQSLLGLVDNMQIADEQSLNLDSQMETFESQVTDAGAKKLEQERNESALLQASIFVGTPSSTVGLQGLAVLNDKTPAETQVGGQQAQPLKQAQPFQQLQEIFPQSILQSDRPESKIDASALATWTTALASGDVQDVRLEPVSSQSPALMNAKLSAAQPNPVSLKLNESKAPENVSLEAKETKVEIKSVDAKDFLLGHTASPVKTADKKESSLGSQSKSHDKSGADGAQANVVPFQGLKAAEALGDSRDARMSPQALSYVSDQVTELKEQGGGRIRVDLENKELGAVELNVTVRGSDVNVEIKAERPEVQQMLNNSKGELMTKIEGQGTKVAQVDVLNVAPERAVVKMVAQVERQKRSAASSEDMIGSVTSKSSRLSMGEQHRSVDDRKLAAHEARVGESSTGEGSDGVGIKTFEAKDFGSFDSRQGSDKSQSQYERSMADREDQRQKDLETWQKKMERRASA